MKALALEIGTFNLIKCQLDRNAICHLHGAHWDYSNYSDGSDSCTYSMLSCTDLVSKPGASDTR